MCYNGKCFYCIPVENGCLVLAIISAVCTGLTLLVSIILGLLTTAGIIFATHSRPRIDYGWSSQDEAIVDGAVAVAGLAAGIIITIVALASLIAFIFSVLLCNGICKRRPGQVQAYFIYGVVITVLAVLASILQLAFDDEPEIGISSLIGCVIYSLFLVLVHHTYVKLRDGVNGAIYKDHVRLVES